MNLSLTYNEIQSFIRKKTKLNIDLTGSTANGLSLKVPVTLMGKTITFPFKVSNESLANNKIRLHLSSDMEGMNDILKGALTVVHNNIMAGVNFIAPDIVEVDLKQIPNLQTATSMIKVSSLSFLQKEVSISVSLK